MCTVISQKNIGCYGPISCQLIHVNDQLEYSCRTAEYFDGFLFRKKQDIICVKTYYRMISSLIEILKSKKEFEPSEFFFNKSYL